MNPGREPIRLWPGVVLVLLQWAMWFGAGDVLLVRNGQELAAFRLALR